MADDEKAGLNRAWVAAAVGLVVLLLAVIFVLQNGDQVEVEFLNLEGRVSLGAALMLAAVLGGLAVLLLGFATTIYTRRRQR